MSETENNIIHARIELVAQEGDFLTADIEVTGDDENAAVVFARYLGTHLQSLNQIAQRQHAINKKAVSAASDQRKVQQSKRQSRTSSRPMGRG
jgi:hypothetical protein